jgi:hypothetical protein
LIVRLPAVVQWTTADGFGAKYRLLGARQTYALDQLVPRRVASQTHLRLVAHAS